MGDIMEVSQGRDLDVTIMNKFKPSKQYVRAANKIIAF